MGNNCLRRMSLSQFVVLMTTPNCEISTSPCHTQSIPMHLKFCKMRFFWQNPLYQFPTWFSPTANTLPDKYLARNLIFERSPKLGVSLCVESLQQFPNVPVSRLPKSVKCLIVAGPVFPVFPHSRHSPHSHNQFSQGRPPLLLGKKEE